MRLLLDTQAVYLWLTAPDQLPSRADAAITDARNHVVVSAVSFWELGIKEAKGRLVLPPDLFETLLTSELQLLDLAPEHAIAAGRLPPHHGDPFDRALIAQARLEGLTLVGGDAVFAEYEVDTLWG